MHSFVGMRLHDGRMPPALENIKSSRKLSSVQTFHTHTIFDGWYLFGKKERNQFWSWASKLTVFSSRFPSATVFSCQDYECSSLECGNSNWGTSSFSPFYAQPLRLGTWDTPSWQAKLQKRDCSDCSWSPPIPPESNSFLRCVCCHWDRVSRQPRHSFGTACWPAAWAKGSKTRPWEVGKRWRGKQGVQYV